MKTGALPKTTRPKPNKAYLAWVRKQPCLVGKGCRGKVESHHVRGYADRIGNITKDDTLSTPLCEWHHRGDDGVHNGLGSHRKFFEVHGIDLLFEAEALFREYLDA